MQRPPRAPWTPLLLLCGGVACTPHTPPAASADPPDLAGLEARGRAPVEALPSEAPEALVVQNVTVMTAAGQVFAPGHVVLVDGRVRAVGAGPAATVPPGARVVDGAGGYLTPGLIDTHSHLGVYPTPGAKAHADGNEATAPVTAGVWAEHSFWPQDPGIQRAVAGGVTSLQALPGSANLIGGRGVVLHLHPALGSRAMRFPGAPETVKMACGENPKRVYGGKGGAPSTRMGNLRGQRTAFIQAVEYQRRWDAYEEKAAAGEEVDPPARDLELETLAGVLRGDVLPQVHCYRADDMLSMLQVADEFGFQVRGFHHALEAYKIRDVLAAAEVSSSTWADWWGFKLEAYDGIPENAALLTEAGARAVIHSDSAEGIQRLNQEAAKALTAGRRAGIDLTDDDALRWITLHAAWTLGIDAEVGSLEPGKRGDLVLWDAHPFSVYARASAVWVDGEQVWDAAEPWQPWSDLELGQDLSIPAAPWSPR